MMYRSGWASKHNQERILAIFLSRKGFDLILTNAYHSLMKTKGVPMKVRLQWDPDYWPNLDRINDGRRAIQLGIPGDLLLKLSQEHIVKIEDVTEVAKNGRPLVNKH